MKFKKNKRIQYNEFGSNPQSGIILKDKIKGSNMVVIKLDPQYFTDEGEELSIDKSLISFIK